MIFLYFIDFFGPYQSIMRLKQEVDNLIVFAADGESNEEEIDMIRKRYE